MVWHRVPGQNIPGQICPRTNNMLFVLMWYIASKLLAVLALRKTVLQPHASIKELRLYGRLYSRGIRGSSRAGSTTTSVASVVGVV
eukprot:2248643-Heterocapsa_arctica.AAC.1